MRDQKTLFAFMAFALFFFIYTQYLQQKYPEYYAQRQGVGEAPNVDAENSAAQSGVSPETIVGSQDNASISSQTTGSSAGAQAQNSVPAEAPRLEVEALVFELPWARVKLRPDGQGFDRITMKEYTDPTSDPKEKIPVELISESLMITVNDDLKPATTETVRGDVASGVETVKGNGTFKITNVLKAGAKDYSFEILTTVENIGSAPAPLESLSLKVEETVETNLSTGSSFIPMAGGQIDHFIVTKTGESATRQVANSFCEDGGFQTVFEGKGEKLDFIGFDGHYFTRLLLPLGVRTESYRLQTAKTPSPEYVSGSSQVSGKNFCSYSTRIVQNFGLMQPGEKRELNYQIYAGPKEEKSLESASATLSESLNFGWFGAIGKPLLAVIKSMYTVTGNYGLAIVLLTICLKILFYPLTKAAAVNMKKLQVLGPELNKIKAKFEGDKQRQQQEVMKFMGQNKINPAKGCLPILPQIPVFIAFYNVLFQSIELRHAPFFGWIQDLSVADPYYITPVIWGAAMLLQQKLTPNPSMDKMQERVMLMMPIVFTFMMITLPAGLILYMVTNSVVSILQQQWLNKTLKVS